MTRMIAVITALLVTAGAVFVGRPMNQESLAHKALAQIDGTVRVPGLRADVKVLRDSWGVPHIYAESTDDLFFTQGYVMAQDRLWQMDIWRRAAEGRMSEIVGSAGLSRDRYARLLKYRGAVDD